MPKYYRARGTRKSVSLFFVRNPFCPLIIKNKAGGKSTAPKGCVHVIIGTTDAQLSFDTTILPPLPFPCQAYNENK